MSVASLEERIMSEAENLLPGYDVILSSIELTQLDDGICFILNDNDRPDNMLNLTK